MPAPIKLARTLAVVGLAVAFCATLGCSGRKYDPASFPVEGSLRWKDGSDASGIGGATVEFEASGNVVAKVQLVADGTFTMEEKLPAGKYRVRVLPPPPAPDAEYDMDARFKQFNSSGLTVTIGSEDPQRISLVLTRTARPNRQ